MAIEVLNLYVNEKDDSDQIIARHVLVGGTVRKNEFLFHTPIMILVSKDEKNAGVLIQNLNRVESCHYETADDIDGIDTSEKRHISLKPGEEIRIWEEYSPREIWIRYNQSDSRIENPLKQTPVSV